MRDWTVYFVELRLSVFEESTKFRKKKNRSYVRGRSCYYVGQTHLTALERFRQHKRAYPKRTLVTEYGQRLIETRSYPRLRSEASAKRAERELTRSLRSLGFGVWSS